MPHFNESRVAKGMKGAKFTYLFYFLLTKYNRRTQFFTKHLGGRHFVDIIGDISWTKGVTLLATSRGQKCPRDVLFLGEFL